MSTKVQFTKDWKTYRKGEVTTLRSAEARAAIKDQVATVQTDLSSESYQTKEISSDGNTKKLRTHNTRRR